MLTIGPYSQTSRVIVAPMAGVTDRPFRSLCRSFGSRWLVSEMVTSDTRLWRSDKSRHRLAHTDEQGIRWVQLAGAEPAMIAEAARRNVDLGAQIIDINMGCPAKKVCNRAAGSALLRDETLVGEILDAVVGAVNVPVTLKIRLGWSPQETNALRIAKIAAEAGVQLLTVHGRTRACRFIGAVDYDAIAEVKQQVDIPVVANGDITSPQQAKKVLEITGCDAVMIGRAAQGQPWVPAHIDHYLETGEHLPPPDIAAVQLMLEEHVQALHDFYGAEKGMRIARKHVGWALDQIPGAAPLKALFNREQDAGSQLPLLQQLQPLTHAA